MSFIPVPSDIPSDADAQLQEVAHVDTGEVVVGLLYEFPIPEKQEIFKFVRLPVIQLAGVILLGNGALVEMPDGACPLHFG